MRQFIVIVKYNERFNEAITPSGRHFSSKLLMPFPNSILEDKVLSAIQHIHAWDDEVIFARNMKTEVACKFFHCNISPKMTELVS